MKIEKHTKQVLAWITIVIFILALIILISYYYVIEPSTPIIAKLTGTDGGSFVESAGFYEGMLQLTDIKTNNRYIVSTCTQDWSWVKIDSCYKLNLKEINTNMESHKYSAELSGCYVGRLESVECK